MTGIQPDQAEWLEPLQEYYASAGEPLPRMELMPGEEVPEPYRRLLVHQRDMTSVLEEYHEGRIELRLLQARAEEHLYTRQVVLVHAATGRPVEFGSIRIHLDRFRPEPQRAIRTGRRPLGGILREHGIAYHSRPRAFLRVCSDAVMNALLELDRGHQLFGRYNVLSDGEARPLAEVIEILPPAAKSHRSRG